MRSYTIALAGLAGMLGCFGGDGPATGGLQQSQECLDHSDQDYQVRVDGIDFATHDGAAVHVVTDMQLAFSADHRCVVSTPGRVVDGGFVAELENRTDGAVYPVVGAFIDVDDDGVCTPGIDLEWRIVGSVAPGSELALTVSPEIFVAGPELGVCAYFE